ncbi:MAG TPA: SusC/RagA family TonB-linked outer membrane protein, partial [Mariniphaga sp.]|nr:SusC/RagA family TonB-linked outer membrane protein [Mariniphaga sp.]
SRFPKNHRFGYFPSFSAGWNINNEPFMQTFETFLSRLKLRGSFGRIGNQVTGNNYYPYMPAMTPYNTNWIDPNTNIRYLSLTSPALVSGSFTWESVQTTNIGVDLGLFESKLNASFDWYTRKTFDMLAPGSELPAILGAAAPLQNVADLESKGWEFDVSWRKLALDNDDIGYSFGFNLSDNRAHITKFDNPAGLITQYYVGQELYEIWGYETHGYFTVEDFVEGSLNEDLRGGTLKEGIAPFQGIAVNPGDIRYVDQNNDGVINPGKQTLDDPGDQKIIGNSNRRYQYGIHGNVNFKNFDLSVFAQGVGKRDIWVSNHLFWPYYDQFAAVYEHHLDYWTPDNTDGFFPRSYNNATGNTGSSRNIQTKYLTDGSYLRIKNITLGYTFPQELLRIVSLDGLRVFLSGENLFSFHNMPEGMDPESTNINYGGIYPFLKKYSFGVNISF